MESLVQEPRASPTASSASVGITPKSVFSSYLPALSDGHFPWWWDNFCHFDIGLQCNESKTKLVIDSIETAALKCPMPLVEMEASLPEDDDNILLVSAPSASYGSAASTSVHWDFLQMMTIRAGHFGLLLPPPLISKPVSHLRKGVSTTSKEQNVCRQLGGFSQSAGPHRVFLYWLAPS